MAAETKQTESFVLLGGKLCLDFVNTAGSHASTNPNEHLKSYADLMSWSEQAGIFVEREARRILREAARRLSEADAVLRRAITLRESLYRIFSAVASGESPKNADLAVLNGELLEAMNRSQIVSTADGFAWTWSDEQAALDPMLWRIARSAADLLTSDEVGRVRECADEVCGWVFLDMSKNQSRRWCDMKECGNQAKSRRHYERLKARR